ncbi:hypothetical protein BD309DRAFT_748067 [Dichomitus squalens]|nr:hypothetical protein BD309DRAFT_748067 [Dichomitus squalens]
MHPHTYRRVRLRLSGSYRVRGRGALILAFDPLVHGTLAFAPSAIWPGALMPMYLRILDRARRRSSLAESEQRTRADSRLPNRRYVA